MAFDPTEEQAEIVQAYATGDDLVVMAGAGTGKTSTLKLIGNADLSRTGTYVAYNRAISDEAGRTFPRNVSCSTAHSLAYRVIGKKYRDRLNGPRLQAKHVANRLGIYDDIDLGGKKLTPIQQSRLVLEMVEGFCHSAEPTIMARHATQIEGLNTPQQEELSRQLLGFARKAWEDIVAINGQLKFEHDHYLKIWGLTRPMILSDYVMLDEAQDANPVIADIINRQKCQRILVGDSSQAIYGWRGAIDAMARFKGTRLLLTQSFRFGPAIAEEANKWLNYLNAPLRLRGFDQMDSKLEVVPSPNAVLCRTNAGAVFEAMMQFSLGQNVALVGGGEAIRRLAVAAEELMAGVKTTHPELFMFESWEEVRDYVDNDQGGGDLKVFVKLIDTLSPRTVIGVIDRLVPEERATVVISTAHKSKGREWNTVRIGNDFAAPEDPKDGIADSEAMLAYVSVTRAKYVLDKTGLAWVDNLKPKSERTPNANRE